MTLRTRLAVAAGSVLVVLLSAGVLIPRLVRASLIDQVDAQLTASLPIGVGLSSGRVFPAPDVDRSPATRLSEIYIARVEAGKQHAVVRPASVSGREPVLPSRTSPRTGAPSPQTVGSVHGSGSWRAVLIALPDGSKVLLALPLDRANATLRRIVVADLIAGGVVLLSIAAAGWWLLRLGLRPIAEVTEVADAIAGGDRSRRVGEAASGTEAAHLARAFNLMLDEQQATEAQLRQFVADASHELRTPVAAIGGFADLWRQGAIDDGQLADVMRRIGQESARMRGLVEDLLLLARLDEGRPVVREKVDLSALAADAALDASATHPSRPVIVEAPRPIIVEGDAARLRQAIANLVTNALVHTDAKATVTVRVECSGIFGVVSVIDDGPGMNAEDARHAFDRFWRADASRSRAGSGLGLAIVRSIADAHGGRANLETVSGSGTSVRILIPLLGESQPVQEVSS